MSSPGQTAPDSVSLPLWRGAALNLSSRLAVVLLGLAILILVARQGPLLQGAFSLFVAIEAALLALGSGLGLLLGREAAEGVPAPRRVRHALGAAVAAGVAAALVLAAVSLASTDDPYRPLWILALAAPCLLLAPTISGLWLGQGRLLALNVTQIASPAAVLAVLALAPKFGIYGLVGTLAAWAMARAIVGLGAAVWGLAQLESAADAPTPTAPRDAWRFVALIALANVVSLANYRATLFIVERVDGLEAAGVYSVAVHVAELVWLLSWAVTVSAYSRIGTRDAAAAVAITLRTVRAGLAATFVAAPVLGLVAWLVLPAVLGEAYRASLLPLALLLPGVAAYAAASGLSAYYTQHRGRPHWAAGIAGLSLALTLAAAAWAVPRWGATGAAVATSSSYLIAVAVGFRLFTRDAGLRFSMLWRGGQSRLPQAIC